MTRKRLDESLSPSRLEKSLGGRGTERPNFDNLVFEKGEVRLMADLTDKEYMFKEVTRLINNRGLQLMLEAIICRINELIKSAQKYNSEDDYLFILKHNLDITLENYTKRYDGE
ncbi:hypothetical protein LCGC14_1273820 [marine sediment metagenome]|uniref:Uncharacterized protein n=1 Tax=marine sediment metagenome TaxID=412755 RepID=A0A0F9KXA2_9ZZZZ